MQADIHAYNQNQKQAVDQLQQLRVDVEEAAAIFDWELVSEINQDIRELALSLSSESSRSFIGV